MSSQDAVPGLIPLLSVLQCAVCRTSDWGTIADGPTTRVACAGCGHYHVFQQGILRVRYSAEHADVRREREAVRQIELNPELGGWRETYEHPETTAPDLKAAYLSLPYGDGSFRFEEPGYFANVRRFAPEFDFVSGLLPASRGRLLDLGADGTWSTARLAALGFESIALDITDHLTLGDLYQSEQTRYARVMADMHEPIFCDSSFDAVTAFNVLHHSRRLSDVAARMAALLKPGGVLGFVEPYVQNDAQLQAFGEPQLEAGVSENLHSIAEWHRTFEQAGLRLKTFSISDSFNAIYQKPASGLLEPGLAVTSDGGVEGYYAARLSGQLLTPAVRANEPVTFRIAITNQGPAGWASRGPWPIRLSYHLRQVDPDGSTTMLAFDSERTLLTEFLAAGQTVELLVPVTFERPGRYELEFDLVHEARCWFAERGGTTCVLRCDVR